jgi:hypothetical protein
MKLLIFRDPAYCADKIYYAVHQPSHLSMAAQSRLISSDSGTEIRKYKPIILLHRFSMDAGVVSIKW